MRYFFKKIFGWTTIVSLVLMSVPVGPAPSAESLDTLSVTLSDSKPSVNATYTITFSLEETASSVTYTFDSDFFTNGGSLSSATITCPFSWSASTSSNGFSCSGSATSGWATTTVVNVRNPNRATTTPGVADVYDITIQTSTGAKAKVQFAIVEGVVVSATVDAVLKFTISGFNPNATSVKGVTVNATSTGNSITFGTLNPREDKVAAQQLMVETNASEGFTVVVYQDHDLLSPAGDIINCFQDGICASWKTATTTPWAEPSGQLDVRRTYSHFGFTSEDTSVQPDGSCNTSTVGAYGNTNTDAWAGFEGAGFSYAAPVMCHVGPSDGATYGVGVVKVGYRIEITPLQPAGEYTNTLTYIATPVY